MKHRDEQLLRSVIEPSARRRDPLAPARVTLFCVALLLFGAAVVVGLLIE